MWLRLLGEGGSPSNGCPALYETGRDTYVVRGWRTDVSGTVEIPHLLLGLVPPDMFIGSALTDTGRGTFTVSGEPVTDPAALAQMGLPAHEAGVEVPKMERTFYGAVVAE
ncbi:hypothetical protein [Nocardia transvalensis]|uniref:hypothetical protein n=1 Tax=Nocardia transvalensis TaxID=37333 RepID=UPI001893DCD5|nr:hypothetical protein [Nocardia transvalensis]MBF6332523.1 hypothetical protein [Nocardia transvalensis]